MKLQIKLIPSYYKAVRSRAIEAVFYNVGFKTSRKILVIESDDWGSIRMPDKDTYNRMLQKGIRVDLSHYNKYDTLADNFDFEHLYDVLARHKDINGNHPVITANTIVANPDFDKIRESNFSKYFFEPFTETLKKYPNRDFGMWQEGIDRHFFFPQLHGREHLNVETWMKYLQAGSNEVHFAFDNKLFGIGTNISITKHPSFIQAFKKIDANNLKSYDIMLTDAVTIFNQIFNYHPESFVATNLFWDSPIEDILHRLNIKVIQGRTIQNTSKGIKCNYMGKKNKNGQTYLVRNVLFEPSYSVQKDWVGRALRSIDSCFSNRKPAIISMHRLNFIGAIFEDNRNRNMKLFNNLLKQITKRWPDVEFLTSAELGNIIQQKNNY